MQSKKNCEEDYLEIFKIFALKGGGGKLAISEVVVLFENNIQTEMKDTPIAFFSFSQQI